MSATEPKYALQCVGCGWRAETDTHQTLCPECGKEALLRAEYTATWDNVCAAPGHSLASFADWMPVAEAPAHWNESEVSCFRSEHLADALGLQNLWIIFSGYWPERGARLSSLSFKDLDAEVSAVRMAERDGRIQLASSAGNLGLAIAQRAILRGNPAVVLIPDRAVHEMRVRGAPKCDNLCLITVKDAIYGEVIEMTEWLEKQLPDQLRRGGGVYNVATRAGHGVTFLNTLKTLGNVPDHYFQAVGSGTGGLGAREAVLRFNRSTGTKSKMRLNLVQNIPFTPIVSAWKNGESNACYPPDEARRRLSEVRAAVLSNNHPPYAIAGGVREALEDFDGMGWSVTNEEIESAQRLFAEKEGAEIHPAGGAALAALRQAVARGTVKPTEQVTLHITGGGGPFLARDFEIYPLTPSLVIDLDEREKALGFAQSFVARSV